MQENTAYHWYDFCNMRVDPLKYMEKFFFYFLDCPCVIGHVRCLQSRSCRANSPLNLIWNIYLEFDIFLRDISEGFGNTMRPTASRDQNEKQWLLIDRVGWLLLIPGFRSQPEAES